MADLTLPFSGALDDGGIAFTISSGKDEPISVQQSGVAILGDAPDVGVCGRSDGLGWAFGVFGQSQWGGTGVRAATTGMWLDGTSGTGVLSTADTGGTGVYGWATGLDNDGRGGVGVKGGSDNGGAGVFGFNSGTDTTGSPGAGVYGASDTGAGVFGTSKSGFAIVASGPTSQSRNAGGWVKALARLVSTDLSPIRRIVRAFNSQIAPTDQMGDSGFKVTRLDRGVYVIDFGFPISDRYILVTADPVPGGANPENPGSLLPSFNQYFSNLVIANAAVYSRTAALVITYRPQSNPAAAAMLGFLPTDCDFTIAVF